MPPRPALPAPRTVVGRELSDYALVPRSAGQPTGLLATRPGYPASRSTLADILGCVIVTAATALEVGSAYFLNVAGGGYVLTLPLLDAVNDGDAVDILTDTMPPTQAASIVTQNGEPMVGGVYTDTTLLCNAPLDRFRIVRAEGQWNVV
jgi:hypothetical protein